MTENIAEKAAGNLRVLRKKRPLIHNITNYVVMNYTANALLSAGASPVMAHAPNEVEEMAALADALLLNIGTLSDDWIYSMIKAGKKAGQLKIPIVLDPVGAGATSLRTNAAKKIISETRPGLIRGNASEILSLGDSGAATKGVDSLHSVTEAEDTAKMLAKKLRTSLAITGPADLITDGTRIVRISNGHPLMTYVTGAGCAASALIAAFMAVDADPLTAAATALAFFGLAGETAARKTGVPGTFMIEMLNALYSITAEDLKMGCRAEVSCHDL